MSPHYRNRNYACTKISTISRGSFYFNYKTLIYIYIYIVGNIVTANGTRINTKHTHIYFCIAKKLNFSQRKYFHNKKITTVRQQRIIAKERGLNGYYKLRKAELEQLLDLPAQKRVNIPKEPKPTPQPSRWQRTKKYAKSKWTSFTNWLVKNVRPIPSIVNNTISSIKKMCSAFFPRSRNQLSKL